MPEKTTPDGRAYRVDGRTFIWTPEGDDGQPADVEIRIPLRVKLKLLRSMAGRDLDTAVMFEMLEALVPNQADLLDDMDVNDFQAMFTAWRLEYNQVSGADLGESSRSSS